MRQTEVDEVTNAEGVRMLNLPTAVEATVACYNLPGVKSGLNFSPEVLAGIFLGKITKWNDKAIIASNPGVRLPNSSIALVQRTNENGSTYAWTDYLSKTSADWKAVIGTTRTLVLPIPLSDEEPESVAKLVAATPNAMSFLELWSAKKAKLQIGRVQNRAGLFVEATPASMLAAVESDLPFLLKDFRQSVTDPSGRDAYPICGFTWVIVPDTIPDQQKRQKVVSFLRWMLTEGQNTPDTLFYGHLPPALVECELRRIDAIH